MEAKKRSREDDHNIPLDRLIEKKRETLKRKSAMIPGLREQRMRIQQQLNACTSRATLRLSRDIARCVEKLDAQIDHIESEKHIEDFERSIVPYVEAFHRQGGMSKRNHTQIAIPETHARLDTDESTLSQVSIVEEFLAKVTGEAPRARIERSDACPRCIGQVMVLVPCKALIVCPCCGLSSTYLDATSQSISYDDSLEMVTFHYKRGNHFSDWLQNCQGAEAHEVSQDIIDMVIHELYKQRVVNIDDITTRRVREILKVHKLRRCYEHCPQIVARVTGRQSLRLPLQVAELCKLMFTALQGPFAKHCPPERKNMLSYSFVLSKMLYILGYDELCDTLSMLKGREKLFKMDVVWEKICSSLDWPYYSSDHC